MQTTNRLLMVRPVRFAFNEETAANNAFQHKSESMQATLQIQQDFYPYRTGAYTRSLSDVCL